MNEIKRHPSTIAGAVFGATLLIYLLTIYPAPNMEAKMGWFVCFVAAVLVFGGLGVVADYHLRRHLHLRREARAHGVATLEPAEPAVPDDAPPPLPPAIPVSMRDPAFQARIERLAELDAHIEAWDTCDLQSYERAKVLLRRANDAKIEKPKLLEQPLIAERRFTALTHCQHGHVATHWLGATTDDHIERICRFEQCAATWLEKR